jgi:hypothetical protein
VLIKLTPKNHGTGLIFPAQIFLEVEQAAAEAAHAQLNAVNLATGANKQALKKH